MVRLESIPRINYRPYDDYVIKSVYLALRGH